MEEIENVYIRTLLISIKMFRILLAFFFINVTFSQQTKSVDFISCEALLYPDAKTKSISGTVHYLFEIKNTIDSVKIDAKNMIFSAIYINDNIKLK